MSNAADRIKTKTEIYRSAWTVVIETVTWNGVRMREEYRINADGLEIYVGRTAA